METVNTFEGGMNSDISKTTHPKNSYLQAINFRPLTELGESNGSLVNIKGNECKVGFPDIQPVYKIILVKGVKTVETEEGSTLVESSTNSSFTITIGGVVSPSLTINNHSSGFELYRLIVDNFQECYQNTTVTAKTFAVAYGDDFVVIYQQPVYTTCSPSGSYEMEISIDYTSGGTSEDPTFQFIGKNGATSLTQDVNNPYVSGVSNGLASNGIKAIGSTFILSDTYILTAPNNVLPESDSISSPGTIWKLNIDDITRNCTLTLLYHNNLDFTVYHPVPPSAITGRYESVNIKRIYWSDNYNKIRTINTAADNLMALSPSIVSVIPKTEYTQAILNGIVGGTLEAGCYQMGYRLSKVLGSITNYSELSLPVYLTTSPEASAFQDYEGQGGTTGKGINWILNDLDTSYDQIEVIIVYRGSAGSVPTITALPLADITSTMSITYSNPAAEGLTVITLEEFLLFNGTFTHAKTCDTKDNRLFWGNVRAPRKGLGSFDARAFRANDAGEILTTNSGVNADRGSTAAAAATFAETEDMINEYYQADGDYSANACYLKPSTATTTKVLGGEGVNISYEFGTFAFEADNDAAINTTDNWDLYNSHVGSPYRGNNTAPGIINLNYAYPQNNKFYSMKQPERTSLLKGLQHEEIYRFGFQAFDAAGNPYFTKWIGDIKMPSYGDVNSNPGYSGVNDFRLTIYGASNNIYLQILYIKFTIDVTSIQDQISGYQIVRVKRDGTNKTIWGCGMINPFISNAQDDNGSTVSLPSGFASKTGTFPGPLTRRYYRPFPSQEAVETLNINDDDSSRPNFGRFKMFDCFDFDTGLIPSFSTGDRILIRSRLNSVNYRNAAGGYRQFFTKSNDNTGSAVPGDTTSSDDGTTPPFTIKSNNDSIEQPYFIFKMTDLSTFYCNYSAFLGPGANPYDYEIASSQYILGNDSIVGYTAPAGFGATGPYNIYNQGVDNPFGVLAATASPSGGKQTLFIDVRKNRDSSANTLYTSDYGCQANSSALFHKLLALYYKPNANLYGGFTYAQRSNNTYIPCGEYISIVKDGKPIVPHIKNYSLPTLGGDVFSTIYDMQKTYQPATGAQYYRFQYDTSSPYALLGIQSVEAKYSSTFFFGCTTMKNTEMRFGNHMNKSLTSAAGYAEDDYNYETFNSAENDVKTYYPKPLNFQTSDEWINRIYYSELKFNNEPTDSWSIYLTNNFYDVEGNYGPINALISLKENMYYIQERGIGLLMINPVSMVNDAMGQPIKLGAGSEVIQKHYYKAIDAGTSHQWSVYRSQSQITFVDSRSKKIYMFNGESVIPISDLKGQRNFVIKRLHNTLLTQDNPVINQGVLTTYDYYHNEFLYTFNNLATVQDTFNDEQSTLVYSEIMDNFTSIYNFYPNLYINTNKYLFSTTNTNKVYLHNYGEYGKFYNILYPSLLKLMVNDNPQYTKVFDNLELTTEVINDNIEWSDDLNVIPGTIIGISYPDDVNHKDKTFDSIRAYNDYQNTGWTTLTTTPVTGNLRRVERSFNLQLPRNKFNYDTTANSTFSIFDTTKLTKTTFGERLRDKWLNIDLSYPNTSNLRFVVSQIKTLFRVSDR